ncbi:MAG TPA: class I adenylate-forming enzyme family protein [Azospirillaceae bacterium]|nr:class I adenylate-forming enzyme family protein [Azospirillaceae bacterium]
MAAVQAGPGIPIADGFRLAEAGRVVSAADIRASAESVAQALRSAGCARLAVGPAAVRDLLVGLQAASATGADLVLVRKGGDGLADAARQAGADHLLAAGSAVRLAPSGAPSVEPRIFLQTSGTTGTPKLVAQGVDRLTARIGPGRSPVSWLLTYDPCGFAGLQVVLSAAIGGHRLAAAPGAGIGELARLAATEGVTHVSGTPSFWRAFLVALGVAALPLKAATLGGEAADQAILDAVGTRFPDAAVRHIYASTEAGVVFTVADGRAGFPAVWLDTGIDGVDLAISGNGTLSVRSPRTHGMGDAGWLDTGDLVRRDGDRMLFAGRRDAVANVGGVKVVPEEVEARILAVPGVHDALVRSKANPITGAILVGEVVAAPGTDRTAIEAAVRSALDGLPPAARPRVLKFVDQLALTAAGKKDRRSA